MDADGRDPREIKRVTGWEKGGDGLWRFELSDLKFKRDRDLDEIMSTDGKLADYVDAPELFEAYPELKDVNLKLTSQLPAGTWGGLQSRDEHHPHQLRPRDVSL